MSAFVIERNVPRPMAPPNVPRTPTSKAMASMEIGDSFAISSDAEYAQVRGRLSGMRPWRYSIRRQEAGGWRVWRVS